MYYEIIEEHHLNISFKTENSVDRLRNLKYEININKFYKFSIYQSTLLGCKVKYVGLAGTSFTVRYK
jgi:hypothetical protein